MPRPELHKPREQCITLLLATLRDIGHFAAKQEAIEHISQNDYFDVLPQDLEPYLSVYTEPRWHTLIAWARKDALIRGFLVEHQIQDCWDISEEGKQELLMRQVAFQQGSAYVQQCYLWTPDFKRYIDPGHLVSDRDAMRPKLFYEDHVAQLRQYILDSL